MKTILLFVSAAVFAIIAIWIFSWGAASTHFASVDCGLFSFLLTDATSCGWPRAAQYGIVTSLALAVLCIVYALITRRDRSS